MPDLTRPSGVPGSAVLVDSTMFLPATLAPGGAAYAVLLRLMTEDGWTAIAAGSAVSGSTLWDPTIESDVLLVDHLTGLGVPESAIDSAATLIREYIPTALLQNYEVLAFEVRVWTWPEEVFIQVVVYRVEDVTTATDPATETGAGEGAVPDEYVPPAGPDGAAEVSGTIHSTESLDGQGGVTSEGGHPYEATDEEDEEYEEQQKSHEEAKEDAPTEEEPGGTDDIYWENETNLLRLDAVDYEFLTMWPTAYSIEIQFVTTYRTGIATHYG